MEVTHKTIKCCKQVNNDTKYIIYISGNAESIDNHYSKNWNWYDENTVIDLCNHPYHSERHNPSVIGPSKSRKIFNNIISLAISKIQMILIDLCKIIRMLRLTK